VGGCIVKAQGPGIVAPFDQVFEPVGFVQLPQNIAETSIQSALVEQILYAFGVIKHINIDMTLFQSHHISWIFH
jgi:hypothetical protein